MFKHLILLFYISFGIPVIDVDANYVDEGELLELDNLEYLIKQSFNNATFYLIVSQFDTTKYIFLEISIIYPRDEGINFLTTIGKNQLTRIESGIVETTYADFNGFYINKDYHNIVIPANSFISGDKFYITNLIINDRRMYQYNLKISKLSKRPCPYNCSQNSGACADGVCLCLGDFIDLDCSKKATRLQINQMIDDVAFSGVQYFFFEQATQLDKVEFEMGLSQNSIQVATEVSVYFLYEDFNFGVPVSLYKNFSLNQEQSSVSKIFDVSKLNFNTNLLRFNRLLIKLVTQEKVSLYLKVSNYFESDISDNVGFIVGYVLISVGGLIFIIVLIWCCLKCKPYRVAQENIQHIQAYQDGDENQITKEFLKAHMVLARREKQSQGQEVFECSICLQDDKVQQLRETPCGHIYHIECIYTWLEGQVKHTSCPNCRKSLNRDILIKARDTNNMELKPLIKQQNQSASINLNYNYQINQEEQESQDIQYNQDEFENAGDVEIQENQQIQENQKIQQNQQIQENQQSQEHQRNQEIQRNFSGIQNQEINDF